MIDKTKKYKMLGLTFEFDADDHVYQWRGFDVGNVLRLSLTGAELEYQVEQGNACEVREPREFTAKGWRSIDAENHIVLNSGLPEWADEFEVTIREVLK